MGGVVGVTGVAGFVPGLVAGGGIVGVLVVGGTVGEFVVGGVTGVLLVLGVVLVSVFLSLFLVLSTALSFLRSGVVPVLSASVRVLSARVRCVSVRVVSVCACAQPNASRAPSVKNNFLIMAFFKIITVKVTSQISK